MPGRFSHIPIANCETTETKCRDSHMPSDLRRPGFLAKRVRGRYDSAFGHGRPRHKGTTGTAHYGVSAGRLVLRDQEVGAGLDVPVKSPAHPWIQAKE